MLRVALTGGLGSGKSAAADVFQRLGAHVSRSDEVGRALMQPGQPVFKAIVEHFGSAVLASDGTLDRSALASLAFAKGRVEEINSLVHPVVIAAQVGWMQQVAMADPFAVAIVESALIFESRYGGVAGEPEPWRRRFDRVVLVTAPEDVRIARYLERVLSSDSLRDPAAVAIDARRRIAAQLTDEQKSSLADMLLPNIGTLADLEVAATSLYGRLRSEASRNDGDSAKIEGESSFE